MTSDQTFVIVGASLAGAKAAETLRSEGFEGRIVLIGAEPHRPYERPPLSKDFLRGEAEREKVYVHQASFYDESQIELRLGQTAVSLDAGRRQLALDSGERLGFDRLLLATGAKPRRLGIPGGELDGIHYLRSLDRLRGGRLSAAEGMGGHRDLSRLGAFGASAGPGDWRHLRRHPFGSRRAAIPRPACRVLRRRRKGAAGAY